MIRVHCKCEQDTKCLALAVRQVIHKSDVLLLSGEMGTGKSVFTRALARAFEIEGPIPSPTFTILLIHEGPVEILYHFDLYRLEDEDELYEMGLNEIIPPDDGIAIIEWPEKCESAMPDTSLRFLFEYDPGDTQCRYITILMPGREEQLRKQLLSMEIKEKHLLPDPLPAVK